MLPETKQKIRELIEIIIIENNLLLKDISIGAKTSYRTVYTFLNNPEAVGVRSMSRLAYFITLYGYNLEDFVQKHKENKHENIKS